MVQTAVAGVVSRAFRPVSQLRRPSTRRWRAGCRSSQQRPPARRTSKQGAVRGICLASGASIAAPAIRPDRRFGVSGGGVPPARNGHGVRGEGSRVIYLVLFSQAFFFRRFTGVAITIGSIVTLFVVMQMTGRIRCSEKFAAFEKTTMLDQARADELRRKRRSPKPKTTAAPRREMAEGSGVSEVAVHAGAPPW